MNYFELYNLLKGKITYEDDFVQIDKDSNLFNVSFESQNHQILTGEDKYICPAHPNLTFGPYSFENKTGIVNEILDIHDSKVKENQIFRYHVFKPAGIEKSTGIIIMFHGFNEKYWYKYLPWAKRLMDETGKTIVMFPIAFHMNRAPHEWSDRRLMYEVSEIRKKAFPNIVRSSLSNVAISARLQSKPERFFWGGLQTYDDVLQLINQIKSGDHPHIDAAADIDIFSYSIGSLLSQILMMTNPEHYFDKSKLCMFCGGAVFNRMSPVSKFILDSESNVTLYSYIIEHFDSHLKNDQRLRHYFCNEHPEGINFRCMLDYKTMKTYREEIFRSLSNQIMAITLEKDTVIPPYEVANTLQGSARNIPVNVEILDFPYEYKHEDPFPLAENSKEMVNQCFDQVFNKAVNFFKKADPVIPS
jgi:hypothetical protein